MGRHHWFEVENPKAYALFVHGLNMDMGRFSYLTSLLNKQGVSCLSLELTGHGKSYDEFKTVSREIWLSDISEAYKQIHLKSQGAQKPLYFFGFSMGGLLGLDFITGPNMDNICPFKKMVLFSPAISLRWYSQLVRVLNRIGPKSALSSWSIDHYKAHPKTPMVAYNALFNSMEEVSKRDLKSANLKTLIFISPWDELVSLKGLAKFIGRKNLSSWRVIRLKHRGNIFNSPYYHITIEPNFVGEESWKLISNEICSHLELD